MASPAEIAQILPDTLPADFSEWDSEESQAKPPVSSSIREAARGLSVVPKPPAQPAEPHVAEAPAAAELRHVDSFTPKTVYVDDEGYFRRLKSVNALVDKLPVAPVSAEAPVVAMDEMRNTASLEAELMRAAGKSFSGEFETESADAELEELRSERNSTSNKKLMVVGVAAGSILLAVFELVHSGALPIVKHMVAPQHAAAAAQPGTNTLKNPQPAAAATPQTATPQAATPSTRPAANLATNATNPRPAPAPVVAKAALPPVQSAMMHDQLTAPNVIPQNVKTAVVGEAPASGIETSGLESPGSSGAVGTVFNGQAQPKVKAAPPKFVNISAGVAVGLLIKKTEPAYPTVAKTARVAGTVVLAATISKIGAIENLHVVSGPAMLRQAAIDAVRTWRYRPYKLDNQPVDVETTVNVIFTLG